MRSRWTALLRKILALDEIPEEELTSLKTVGDCVRYLSTKLG